ncbi:hypothetical protein [Thauera sp. Sel9]|uniref:hypothetical protein n=1 Tax=Thauera sp. Sel9 TaxID=2974299 RepID=UPI0021E18234|nr:hypothetical protein [Thauera sp. Sel9]MCV2217523.1 hypothetical protein [Thauera sp. Sel9]
MSAMHSPTVKDFGATSWCRITVIANLMDVQGFHLSEGADPDLRLLLIGRNPQDNNLKAEAQQPDVADKVIFAGHASPAVPSPRMCAIGRSA